MKWINVTVFFLPHISGNLFFCWNFAIFVILFWIFPYPGKICCHQREKWMKMIRSTDSHLKDDIIWNYPLWNYTVHIEKSIYMPYTLHGTKVSELFLHKKRTAETKSFIIIKDISPRDCRKQHCWWIYLPQIYENKYIHVLTLI